MTSPTRTTPNGGKPSNPGTTVPTTRYVVGGTPRTTGIADAVRAASVKGGGPAGADEAASPTDAGAAAPTGTTHPTGEPAAAGRTAKPAAAGRTAAPAAAGRTAERTVTRRPGDPAFSLVKPPAPRPRTGWQAVAYRMTGGRWNPGIGEKERRQREREEKIATHLKGKHVTAFFCLKGGIGKTSTTAGTTIALADLRPDPVFAIDANPDAGDLSERLVGDSMPGIAELAHHIDEVDSLEALSRYTATRGRLTVLPGEPNPTLGDSLSADDFDAVMRVVQRYYSFVQVDCGTGVTHPLMEGVLRYADTVVIPAAWSVTGAKRATETIAWLREHGFGHLADTCIVVLTAKDVVSASVDKEAVLDHLSYAGEVIVVPADPHVADGTLLDWDALAAPTREAYLDIAAAITARFRPVR